jgi:hypothetical protein
VGFYAVALWGWLVWGITQPVTLYVGGRDPWSRRVMSKTRKQPYRQARRFDKTCRNHGSCPWCRRNRLHGALVREAAAAYALREAIL